MYSDIMTFILVYMGIKMIRPSVTSNVQRVKFYMNQPLNDAWNFHFEQHFVVTFFGYWLIRFLVAKVISGLNITGLLNALQYLNPKT